MKRGIISSARMVSPSASLRRLKIEYMKGADPFTNLANAIVTVAADDYRFAVAHPQKNRELVKDLEKFFNSEWFRTLTTADADIIMSRIKAEPKPKRSYSGQKRSART